MYFQKPGRNFSKTSGKSVHYINVHIYFTLVCLHINLWNIKKIKLKLLLKFNPDWWQLLTEKFFFEEGAQWIHGADGNSIKKMADENGISSVLENELIY